MKPRIDLTREQWTRRHVPCPAVQGLICNRDGSSMQWRGETGARVYGQSFGTSLSISLGRHGTVFQVEIYNILACAYKMNAKPEKHDSICSDSQAS